MWLAIALVALVALAAALVVVEPLVMFGWPAATAAEPAGRHAAAGIANTNPFYEGQHCAADPEATTAVISVAALIRPYATTGGTP